MYSRFVWSYEVRPVLTVTKGLMDTEDGKLLTSGGRVLGAVSTAEKLADNYWMSLILANAQ